MRVFIALEFNDDIKTKLNHLTHELCQEVASGHFYLQDNFHLTLRFVGEVAPHDEAKTYEQLVSLIQSVASETRSFSYTVNGLGSFTKKKRHILWAGVSDGLNHLQQLADYLEARLQKLGYAPAEPSFTAHITLGRGLVFKETITLDRASVPADALVQLSKRVDELGVFPLQLTAEGLTIMESRRVEGVLRYLPLCSTPFRERHHEPC